MDKPRLYVDFNELVEEDLVLLSQEDIKHDCDGNEVHLYAGKVVDIYSEDTDENGYEDNLIASGVVEKNLLELFPRCKWNCRINADGIYHESDAFCNALKSNDASLVAKTLLYITFHHSNDRWVQDICLLLLDNENADIKGLAITCLGHLARIHKRLDTKKVFAILEDKKDDEALKGRIEDAIEDITLFVGT